MRKLFKVKVNGTAYDVEVEEVYETATISAKPITSTTGKTPESKISTSLKEIFDFDKDPTSVQPTSNSPSAPEVSSESEPSSWIATPSPTASPAPVEASSWAAMPSPTASSPTEQPSSWVATPSPSSSFASSTPESAMPTTPTIPTIPTPVASVAPSISAPTAPTTPSAAIPAAPATPSTATNPTDNFLSQYQQLYSEKSDQPAATEPESSPFTASATSTITAPTPEETAAKPFEFNVSHKTPQSAPRTGNNSVLAPMQGTIVQIPVREGSAVHYGDILCVISCNGIESEIMSPVDAEVVGVYVRPGSVVNTNDILITLT